MIAPTRPTPWRTLLLALLVAIAPPALAAPDDGAGGLVPRSAPAGQRIQPGAEPEADAAQDEVAVPIEEGIPDDLPPPGPPPPEDRVDALTYDISSGLRCPVCQGLSVADSPSATAVAMKGRVEELVRAGYTEQQIQDYFVARYGEWVLLQPRATGISLMLWIVPGLLLALVLAYAATVVGTWRREPDDVPLPSDVGLTAKDPYEERLLAEMEDDT